MSAAALILLFGSRPKVLQTVTFSANETWVCPSDVNLLSSVVGHGVNGTAPSGSHNYVTHYFSYDAYHQRTYRLTDGTQYSDPAVYDGTFSGSPPRNYCDKPIIAIGVPGLESYVDCYNYPGIPTVVDEGDYDPGTTGSSATGFGKTFAGGTPSTPTAATTSHSNVAVTPSSSYPVVVPAGAAIQITYYQ